MKALSVQQPYAWKIVQPYPNNKDCENRSWYTAYRGPLLIHASTNQATGSLYFVFEDGTFAPPPETLTVGAIIGIVRMVDCVSVARLRTLPNPSKFGWGPACFVFRDPYQFPEPIAYSGNLGIFNVPDSLVADQIPRDYLQS